MFSDGPRLTLLLFASAVLHVIAIAAVGPERLGVAPAPADLGHEVSVRLQAAAIASAPEPTATPRASADEPAAARTSSRAANPPVAARARAAPTERSGGLPDTAHEASATARPTEPASGYEPDSHEPPAASEQRAAPTADAPDPHPAERSARTAEPATGAARHSSVAQRAEVRAAIVAELARHFRYPRLAQRRGWEGTVVLRVRILPDGRLARVRIEQSSGLRLLDRSARNSLARIGRLSQFAGRVGGDGMDLRIPVTYRLESA